MTQTKQVTSDGAVTARRGRAELPRRLGQWELVELAADDAQIFAGFLDAGAQCGPVGDTKASTPG